MLNKLESHLFYILLFSIPFQVRKILYYPDWRFSEWQSVGIYATDILLAILLVLWLFNMLSKRYYGVRNKSLQQTAYSPIFNPDFYLILFTIFAGISIKNSSAVYLSVYTWLRLIEFILFYFYIKSYAIYKFDFSKSAIALVAGGSFQAGLAIIQFLRQSHLGLHIIGENILDPQMKGVAVFLSDAGDKIIRAYGTTPHPNILAAYLFLAIFAAYCLIFYYSVGKFDKWTYGAYFLLLMGLFFTFSRTIIFLWTLSFLIRIGLLFFKSEYRLKIIRGGELRSKILKIGIVTLAVIIIFSVFYWPLIVDRLHISGQDEAVALRIYLNKESLGTGINLFGVGIGNFVNWFMKNTPGNPIWMYQPVHNIYLLLYSEVGITGLVFFILFLVLLMHNFIKETKLEHIYDWSILLMVLSILSLGLFDHFLFTLQQGRFVFWLLLGLLSFPYSKIIKRSLS